jgi:hypothetical protein
VAYLDIVQALAALVGGVSGVANVYTYRRDTPAIADFESSFLTGSLPSQQVHAWFVTRVAAPSAGYTDGDITRDHEFRILGFIEVSGSGESELEAQRLADEVMNTLNANRVLLEGCAVINDAAQLVAFGDEALLNVLCHGIEIGVMVQETMQAD